MATSPSQGLKVDIINRAYSRLRISGVTAQPSAEDLELALSQLEDLVAELEDARNICLNYNREGEPDPNSVSNVPAWARDCLSYQLALRLIPDFNKAVPPQLERMAAASLSAASSKSAADRMRRVQYPERMPTGSGNHARWSAFYRPATQAPQDCTTQRIQAGETRNYTVLFADVLEANEALASYTVSASDNLTVSGDAIVGTDIDYTVAVTGCGWQTVKFTVTTDAGRTLVRVVNFDVSEPQVA